MKKIAVFSSVCILILSCSLGADFIDVEGHWANLNILKASNNGFFNGYPDGTFKPNNTITRLEFITILTKVLDSSVEIDIDSYDNIFTYSDLSVDSWGKPFYNRLMYYANAFLDGKESEPKGATLAKKVFGNSLSPSKPITREEAVSLMAFFLDEDKLDGEAIEFSDTLESIYRIDIEKFCKSGIIKGYPDGTFKPNNNITRAEATVIIGELFNNKDIIKHIEDKKVSTYLSNDVIRSDVEDVIFQILLNDSINEYSKSYQYLSYNYKESNSIVDSNDYAENQEAHILPKNFIFDENTINITVGKEKDGVMDATFSNVGSTDKYKIEMVLVGVEDWYINSKNY